MASSAPNQHLHGGATSAPPPTPSAQPNNLLSTAAAADTLSHLLLRLPPSLSLPTTRRRATSTATTSHPLVTLSDDTLLSSSRHHQLGFFQLTGHSVPPQLADSAESEALSLFDLSPDEKQSHFPKNWPLGYHGREDDDGDGGGESFCLSSARPSVSPELSLPSLSELTRELERVGLRILELLSGSLGFENRNELCTLTWLSDDAEGKEEPDSVGFYPYIVGLQYQTRTRKCSLLGDSGWVSVVPQADSVLVTIGDIAQVWSNGKVKKVRGRPIACSLEECEGTSNKNNNNGRNISITVLITLPLDATVSPILPRLQTPTTSSSSHSNLEPTLALIIEDDEEEDESCSSGDDSVQREKRLFSSFSFEDYAWRVYHERLTPKDPLDRYRLKM